MSKINPYLRMAREASDSAQAHRDAGRVEQAAWYVRMFHIHKAAAMVWAGQNPSIVKTKAKAPKRAYPIAVAAMIPVAKLAT